jgi:outer membrane protein assembly factor BamB
MDIGACLALRQMLSMSVKWKLHADSQDLLRRHLAASCWREAGRLICREPLEPSAIQRALVILDEAERLELVPVRKLWVMWTRAWLDQKDANAVNNLKTAMRSHGTGWIPFPDGLMLAAAHAPELLAADSPPHHRQDMDTTPPPLAPLDLAWGYQTAQGTRIQRFTISPDGGHVLVADDRSALSVLDRRSGKLLWTTATMQSRSVAPPPVNPNIRSERVLQPLEFVADDERVFFIINGQIECRKLASGELQWSHDSSPSSTGDLLATGHSKLLRWQPGSGTLDAFHVESGKLAWTRAIEPLKKQTPPQPGYGPAGIAAGVSIDAGKVLAYANGAAIVRLADGALLWQTNAEESPAFPLELRAADEELTAPPATVSTMSWSTPVTSATLPLIFLNSYPSSFNALVTRRSYAHPMTVNPGGYAGMYGGAAGSSFLNWGSEGVRVLRGNGVWSLSNGAQPNRVSVSGLPVISDSPAGNPFSGMLIGFAGGWPVTVNETSVSRGAATLWQAGSTMRSGAPAEQSFPAATLHGRTLLVASTDGLMARDAVGGEELFRCELPKAAQTWAKGAWDQLKSFQAVRWSARGVVFYDGQGGSLVVDWRSAAHGGDWIVPLGLDKLGCLRGVGARQTASLEAVK